MAVQKKTPRPKATSGPYTRSRTKQTNALSEHTSTFEDLTKRRNQLQGFVKDGVIEPADEDELARVEARLEKYHRAGQMESSVPTNDQGTGVTAPGNNTIAKSNDENHNTHNTSATAPKNNTIPSMNDERDDIHMTTEAPKKRIVDELGVEWELENDREELEPGLDSAELGKDAIGHMTRGRVNRYCVRYGDSTASSARIECKLPDDSKYTNQRSMTEGRILEDICKAHDRAKTGIPPEIVNGIKILAIYWDSKQGLGHKAEMSALNPVRKGLPITRCFIYLDPKLYTQVQEYNIVNKTGFSHETKSTILRFLDGNSMRNKKITLYNTAVRLENRFEEYFMQDVPDRPGPLQELSYFQNDEVSDTQPWTTTNIPGFHSTTPEPTVRSPSPFYPRQASMAPSARLNNPIPQIRISPPEIQKKEFYKDLAELLGIAGPISYEDLPPDAKVLVVGQFRHWKDVVSGKLSNVFA